MRLYWPKTELPSSFGAATDPVAGRPVPVLIRYKDHLPIHNQTK
jgi:hypothetical protein